MNKQHSPVASVKQVLRSNKITFLCVVFTVTALFSLISLAENRLGFENILGSTLYDLLGKEAVGIIDTVSGVVFFFSIIGLIPQILTVIAFWLLRVGAADDSDDGMKKILYGFNFFKINLLYKSIVQGLAVIGTILVGLAVLFIAMDVGADMEGLLVIAIITAIIALVLYLILKYYTNFLAMLTGVSNTLRSGLHMIISVRQVIVFNYIGAVFSILGSFGSLEYNFWAFVSSFAMGLCLILINRCFADLEQLCGNMSREESKDLIERIKTDPSLAEAATVLGFNSTETGVKKLIGTLFGTSFVSTTFDDMNSAPVREESFIPEENAFRPASTFTERPRNNGYVPNAETRLLTLFDRDMDILEDRYTLLGKQTISKGVNCPVAPIQAEIVYDSVSEKKLLRLSIKNVSSAPIQAITLEITPKDNDSQPICVYRKVVINPNEPVYTDTVFGADCGILLPDDATNGIAKVTLVEFTDGLYRDKESDEFYFSTDEKTEYDTDLYLSITTRIREKEL